MKSRRLAEFMHLFAFVSLKKFFDRKETGVNQNLVTFMEPKSECQQNGNIKEPSQISLRVGGCSHGCWELELKH